MCHLYNAKNFHIAPYVHVNNLSQIVDPILFILAKLLRYDIFTKT